MPSLFNRAFTAAGRFLEFVITGQSEFTLITSDFQKAEIIDNSVQAKLALKEVTVYLKRNFGIELQHPVIITLEKPQTRDWKRVISSAGNHVGCYATRWLGEKMSHEILVVPGMERRKFKAVLAHELTHAFQAERHLLNGHRGLKEGMSRWVEYHVLLELGLKGEAKKLRSYRRFILGRGVLTILDYEKKHGFRATLEWLKGLG